MNTNKYDEIIKKSYRLKITHLNDQGYGVASNLLINKRLKKSRLNKKIQKGSANNNYNCGDIQVYKGFCHDLPSQCCDTTNSNVCSRSGGGKLKNKKLKNKK